MGTIEPLSPEAVATELSRYSVTRTKIESPNSGWNYTLVSVLRDGERIGAYERNYSAVYNTFLPFYQNGAYYALYSRHYTATRVMRLPDCVDIGGEEPADRGFCPTDFYVPYQPKKQLIADWGLVAGAVWADDATWKIQYLDLSQVSQGILKREEKFGRLVLPENLRLRDAVDLSDYSYEDEKQILFTTQLSFSLAGGNFNRDYGGFADNVE